MVTKTETVQAEGNGVVTMETAKKQLRVDPSFTDEDELIAIYIASAQAEAEGYIGRAVGLQRLVVDMDRFGTLVFGAALNDSIEKVEYYPEGSEEIAILPDTSYRFRKQGADSCEVRFIEPLPATAVRPDAVIVTVKRGFAPSACPAPIKKAMLLMIADGYDRREDRGEIGNNSASTSLMRPFRRWH